MARHGWLTHSGHRKCSGVQESHHRAGYCRYESVHEHVYSSMVDLLLQVNSIRCFQIQDSNACNTRNRNAHTHCRPDMRDLMLHVLCAC